MFQGFSEQVIDFMWGIRFNNDKAWFETHKEEYLTYFYRPMRALAEEVFGRFAPAHPDLDLSLRLTRIYRDARRLHGRGPYKDRLWFSIERPREENRWCDQPAYWFELEPEGYSYGLGYWQPKPVTMARFRARLDRDPKAFAPLARSVAAQDVFVLRGEDYRRPKGQTVPLFSPWYNKKGFSLSCERSHDALLRSPALADTLTDGFEQLLPLYRYFLSLEGDPAPAP